MYKYRRTLLRAAKLLPVLGLYQSIGCLPNNAFAQVFAENIVLTAAVAIQTITSIIFNTLFGVI
ncbi:MAG: hypothetical protein KF841_06895 [Phycisphaerae bacterium]|nr:hypothetical protein [Phycisphaerae bacterium]